MSVLTKKITPMSYLLDIAQKRKFPFKDFFSKCDQNLRKLRIWSHLLKNSLIENFILCALRMALITQSHKGLPFYLVRSSKISVRHGKLISGWILSGLTHRCFWSMFCLDFIFGKKTRRDSGYSIIQPTLCCDTFRRGQRRIQNHLKHLRRSVLRK